MERAFRCSVLGSPSRTGKSAEQYRIYASTACTCSVHHPRRSLSSETQKETETSQADDLKDEHFWQPYRPHAEVEEAASKITPAVEAETIVEANTTVTEPEESQENKEN